MSFAAVIGAGIGGASTTHFLKSLFGVSGASVDVFEKGKIGGRLALVKIGKEEYESGGSIIHDKNKYMRDFMKMLGMYHN